MAKILLIATGTLGDVLPMIYVGERLQVRGHQVRIIAHDSMRAHVEERSMVFASIGGNDPKLAQTDYAKVAPGSNVARVIAHVWRLIRSPDMPNANELLWLKESVEWCDLVLGSHMSSYGAYLAEKLQKPWITFHPTPTLPSRAYPHPVGPLWWHLLCKPGVLNLATHKVWEHLVWRGTRKWTNSIRTALLDMAPLPSPNGSAFLKRLPRLIAASKAVFPPPSDWPTHWYMTGYCYKDDSFAEPLSPAIEHFLRSGAPPVFIGFSSSPILNRSFWQDVVVPAIKRVGCRAILGSGWSSFPEALDTSTVLAVENVPFRQLFPQVSCVVHACGMGTLSEAICSGTPSVGVPVFGEQKMIAAQAYRKGLIPRPCLLRHLTAKRLASMIQEATIKPNFRLKTGQAKQQMIEEHGIHRACEVIESYLPS